MAGKGRKVWTRETLSASEVQDYLQDQTVMTFTSASARSAAIPAPSRGMVSHLQTTDRWEGYRNGGPWAPFGHNWGVQSSAPAGANPGDLCILSPWQCSAVKSAGGSWRQIEVPVVAGTTQRDQLDADATAAGAALYEGFQVWDSTNNRLWSRVTGGWQLVGGKDSAASSDASALSINGGWSLQAASRQILANGLCFLSATFTRTGAAITATTQGDITNVGVASMGSTWAARYITGLPAGSVGRQGTFYVSGSLIEMAGVGPGGNVATGDQFSFAGTYPLATPPS